MLVLISSCVRFYVTMVTSLKYIRDFISVIYRESCFWKLNQMLKSEISLALGLLATKLWKNPRMEMQVNMCNVDTRMHCL